MMTKYLLPTHKSSWSSLNSEVLLQARAWELTSTITISKLLLKSNLSTQKTCLMTKKRMLSRMISKPSRTIWTRKKSSSQLLKRKNRSLPIKTNRKLPQLERHPWSRRRPLTLLSLMLGLLESRLHMISTASLLPMMASSREFKVLKSTSSKSSRRRMTRSNKLSNKPIWPSRSKSPSLRRRSKRRLLRLPRPSLRTLTGKCPRMLMRRLRISTVIATTRRAKPVKLHSRRQLRMLSKERLLRPRRRKLQRITRALLSYQIGLNKLPQPLQFLPLLQHQLLLQLRPLQLLTPLLPMLKNLRTSLPSRKPPSQLKLKTLTPYPIAFWQSTCLKDN